MNDMINEVAKAAEEAGLDTVIMEPEIAKKVYDGTKVIVASVASFILGITTTIITERKILPRWKARKADKDQFVEADEVVVDEDQEEETGE